MDAGNPTTYVRKTTRVYKTKTGRPTKYRPEFCQDIIDYFKKGETGGYYPTLDGFCCTISCTPQMITDWCGEHPEFKQAKEAAQVFGRQQLVQGALTNRYNANFARFVGINLGMISENSQAKVANTHEFPSGININFVGGSDAVRI
jgi:hypothetical protein